MKKLFAICSLMVLFIAFTAFSVAALPKMDGGISFSGGYELDTGNISTANSFTNFSNVVIQSGSGTWADVTPLTPATFNSFTFNPPSNVTPLWSFTFDGITYTLNADGSAMTFVRYSGPIPSLDITGTGWIYASSGYDPTAGAYKITANQGNTTFSFSASSVTVPEPGTLLLLGFGLLGLAGFRRKLKG
jgi:hypothetical protein